MTPEKIRKKTKLVARDYDEALDAIETILGMSATLALFVGKDVKDFVEIPTNVKYAIGITASYMLAFTSSKEKLDKFGRLDLAHIEDIEKKLDVVLDYLNEVREARKNEKPS